ncbi:hypothetical protein F4677DRAFT_28517 [Hypoxylon crocopeplum]|nr:hypothetical protein F4677DRAFT_28517 [Hypoxylon crocopeplum]
MDNHRTKFPDELIYLSVDEEGSDTEFEDSNQSNATPQSDIVGEFKIEVDDLDPRHSSNSINQDLHSAFRSRENVKYKYRYILEDTNERPSSGSKSNKSNTRVDAADLSKSENIKKEAEAANDYNLYVVTHRLTIGGEAISRTGRTFNVRTVNFRHWGLLFQNRIYHLVRHRKTIYWQVLRFSDPEWAKFSKIGDPVYTTHIGHADRRISGKDMEMAADKTIESQRHKKADGSSGYNIRSNNCHHFVRGLANRLRFLDGTDVHVDIGGITEKSGSCKISMRRRREALRERSPGEGAEQGARGPTGTEEKKWTIKYTKSPQTRTDSVRGYRVCKRCGKQTCICSS